MDLKKNRPLIIALSAGILGFCLRLVLYRTGFDEKNILSASHPLHLLCLILTVIATALLARAVKGLPAVSQSHPLLRFILGTAAGSFLLLHGVLLYRQIAAPLGLIHCALTVLAGIAMVVCVFPAEQSPRVSAVCHGIVCVGFAGDMLGRYQAWSGNPQLPDYVFHVLAGVALSLTAYQTLALHTELGSPKWQKFWGFSSLFLCLMCLAGPEPWEFYLGGALWAGVCLLTVLPPEEPLSREEETDVSA